MANKNEKFDSFLKRTLDKKTFNQVKAFEPCVVFGKGENYSFRFSFFTDEALYISENPPKSLLLKVPYSCIFSIFLIHDTATFLQKDLQENVQHVLITLYAESSKNEQASNNDTKPNGSTLKHFVSTLRLTKTVHSNTSILSDPVHYQSESANGSKKADDKIYSSKFLSATASNSTSANLTDLDSQKSASSSRASNGHSHTNLAEIHKLKMNRLHLYVLNADSLFYSMLVAVWKAYLLSFTSQHDSILKPSMQTVSDVLLDELKRDILSSNELYANVEDVYRLFSELNDVIRECFKAKSYYWKDADLVRVCQKLLVKYSNSATLDLVKRNDEIECMVMICDVLSQMFTQVEALHICDATLQSLRPEFYANLVSVLLCRPSVASTMLLDPELQAILEDYVAVSCSVLYEVIVAAERASWKIQNPQVFSTGNLFSRIDSNHNLIDFLKRVITFCVHIWTPAERRDSLAPTSNVSDVQKPLKSTDVVKIYHCFMILYHCLKKCKTYENVIRDRFKEEFKYYIRPESLEHKVPLIYPASHMTQNIISTVAKLVLDNTSFVEQSAIFHVKKNFS